MTRTKILLQQALQIDSRNTELQNAYSDLLRELKRHKQQLRLGELLRSAREESDRQRYTEAISYLRVAAETDPVHPEVASLLSFAMTRQKEGQPQQPPDLTKSNMQEPLDQEDSGPTEDYATRVMETLSADGSPLKPQSEVGDTKPEVDIEQEVTTSASKLGLLANANDGADSTKLLQIPQQLTDKTEGENGLTLQFSEAVLKTQLVETPSIRRDLTPELPAKRDELTAKAKNEEIRAAVEGAVTACDAAMAANKFDHCLRSLDDLEKQYPGNVVSRCCQKNMRNKTWTESNTIASRSYSYRAAATEEQLLQAS
ncbi:hypothetical protein RBB78_08040 [Tunturiibacter empetritectus]|uniref:hypothetical protein n=1 Tax=Tunturiibacter empetritectus TaxID=3069691 RepID=UPI003D9B5A50